MIIVRLQAEYTNGSRIAQDVPGKDIAHAMRKFLGRNHVTQYAQMYGAQIINVTVLEVRSKCVECDAYSCDHQTINPETGMIER